MPNWFYDVNVYLALFLIFIACNTVSLIGYIIARKYFSVLDNRDVVTKVVWQTILFFSTMFITFWIATNWQNIGQLSEVTAREANTISSLYNDANSVNKESRKELTTKINNYLSHVINEEYPLLKQGRTNNSTNLAYRELVLSVYAYSPAGTIQDQLRYNRMLEQMAQLSAARESRLSFLAGNMSGPLLYFLLIIIILGCFWTGCITTKSIIFSMFILMSQNLIISSSVWLILEMDKPFQGVLSIEDEAFVTIQEEIRQHK